MVKKKSSEKSSEMSLKYWVTLEKGNIPWFHGHVIVQTKDKMDGRSFTNKEVRVCLEISTDSGKF